MALSLRYLTMRVDFGIQGFSPGALLESSKKIIELGIDNDCGPIEKGQVALIKKFRVIWADLGINADVFEISGEFLELARRYRALARGRI